MLSDSNSEKEVTSITDTADVKTVNTPMTIDSGKNNNKYSEFRPKTNKHNYLLIKNLPSTTTCKQLKDRYRKCPGFQKLIMIPNSSNVYIKFAELAQVQGLIEQHEGDPDTDQKVKMCLVNKLPLDLNEKSRILLITVYNEKIDINVNTISHAFKEFGSMNKIIIFKKKNYQMFIEFKNAEDAYVFKQSLHNINYKGMFFLKIQFTQKNSLIIRGNNLYEHDFSKAQSSGFYPKSVEFSAGKRNGEHHANSLNYNNIVSSFNTLDDRSERSLFSPSRNEKPAKKKLFIIKVKNVHSDVKHKTLFNLFSLYGTIEKITIDSLEECGYVFFHSEFDQITAYHYLNSLTLFERVIFLELIKPDDETESEAPKHDNPSNTVFYAKNRIITPVDMQNKQKTINKPCNILYVFNLSKSASLNMIKDLFQTFEPVVNIYYLNHSRNSALCFFNSTEAAVRILCVFKNINMVDKSLKINFANESLVRANEQEKMKLKFTSLQSFDYFDKIGVKSYNEFTPGSVKDKKSRFRFFQGKEFRMF